MTEPLFKGPFRIDIIERIGVSTNGNPRYRVTFDGGATYDTQSDASCNYGINNPEWLNVSLDIALSKAGKITHIRKHIPPRMLTTIAQDIRRAWQPVNYAAAPYLDAMRNLGTIDEMYGCDTADSVVRYFLSNAGTWRGETAKRIKAELKGMLK